MTFKKACQKKNENRTYTSIVPHKSFRIRWEIGNVPKKKMCSNFERHMTGLPRILHIHPFRNMWLFRIFRNVWTHI